LFNSSEAAPANSFIYSTKFVRPGGRLKKNSQNARGSGTKSLLDSAINNEIYEELGDRWYTATDDPVALLRAEERVLTKWVAEKIAKQNSEDIRILDVGCGAGFLSNELGSHGWNVTGVDASKSSLTVARTHDGTDSVAYVLGNGYRLPYLDSSFSDVCAMDFLEHVEEPSSVIGEIARVLKPGGRFYFHTFNRNLLAYLVVIKGLEWFVPSTPRDLHVLRYFIKPSEMKAMFKDNGLSMASVRGFGPRVSHPAFWRMLWTGHVVEDFEFEFKRSMLISYAGMAIKEAASSLSTDVTAEQTRLATV